MQQLSLPLCIFFFLFSNSGDYISVLAECQRILHFASKKTKRGTWNLSPADIKNN